MADVGDVVYCICKDSAGASIRLCGWVVARAEDDVVLAVGAEANSSVEQVVRPPEGSVKIAFLRVDQDSVVLAPPAGWKGTKPKDLPAFASCQGAWKKVDKDTLSSSEAEPPVDTSNKARRPKSGLAADLGRMSSLFEGSGSEEEDEEEAWMSRPRSSGHLPPGAKAPGSSREAKSKEPELDMRKVLAKALAGGQSGQDLMPLMFMSLLMDQKKKKSRKEHDTGALLGGSSDDSDEDSDVRGHGMKAVSTLHRLHQKIRSHPRRVCSQFEKEVVEELGVVCGQPWTLRDFLKRQSWGRFKGIYRCAVMDAVAYELLRSGEADAAAAQLVQNMKAKIQSVIQGGDWSAAWLLTGIADPLVKREFAGSKEEMAVVSGYLDAVSKLRKKVNQSASSHAADHEEDDGAAKAARK